jgi:hypothetical protein
MSYGNKADTIYFDEILYEPLDVELFCSDMIGKFAEIKSVPKAENIKVNEDKITYKWVDIGGILNGIL